MAGNTVVLKPAQLTPWSGSELGRIVAEETDIPAGVFNVVVSNANEVGAALSADPRVDMITFTGSTATGRAILAAGAPTVKKTLLELGGKSAHIVLDDADFNSALPMAAMMACVMSGQSCILPSRILLPRSAMTRAGDPQGRDGELPGRRSVDSRQSCRGRRSAQASGRRCSA